MDAAGDTEMKPAREDGGVLGDDNMAQKILNAINNVATTIEKLGDRRDRRIDAANCETFLMSKMTHGSEEIVLCKLDLVTRDIGAAIVDVSTQPERKRTKHFKWERKTETQQAEDYANHLVKLLPTLKTRLVHADNRKEEWKLETDLSRRQLKLVGFADLMVIRTGRATEQQNVHVAIETKKATDDKSSHKSLVDPPSTHGQAIAQLIALDHHAKGPVVTVATDLHDAWTFFWLVLCPKTDAAGRPLRGPRKREVHVLSLTKRSQGLTTLAEILDHTDTLACASFTCACGEAYKNHLTKFNDMEVAAAEALADAGHLETVTAQAQDDSSEAMVMRHDRHPARLPSCVTRLQSHHAVDLRPE